MELKKYKLKEILDVKRGASLSGENYATDGEYIRLTCGNFDYHNNCFKENKSKDNIYYNGEFSPEFLMQEGDIITPLTEQALGLLGSTAFVPESDKYIQSQDIAKIICNEKLLDKNFAYYLISSNIVKQQLNACAQQTKIRHTSPDKIKDCIVWIPELNVQKFIGHFLRSIDDKLEINRQINQNLEAMTKQLYDYWFVQFDFPNEEGKPYKSSGGEIVWNEKLKREIPKDWQCCEVKDFMRIFTGKKDVSKAIPGPYKFFSCAPNPISSDEYIYDGAAVLVSGNGSYTGRVSFYKGKLDLYQRTYACVLDVNDENIPFFYYTLKYLFQPIYSGGKHGSSIPYIVLGDLANFRFAYNKNYVKAFIGIVKDLFEEQQINSANLESLTKQRDELLPLLMNGQVSVNSDLSESSYIIETLIIIKMKESIIQSITNAMQRDLDYKQMEKLKEVLNRELNNVELSEPQMNTVNREHENNSILNSFISAKKIEGCSDKTLFYYRNTIEKMLSSVQIAICHIETNSIRKYLSDYQEQNNSSKVTIDNMRRIFSSFFSWLEDEDYIAKSPVRRIHKVKTDSLVKEVLTDEQLEQLRDSCSNSRDLAIIDILSSTGIRVGELVKLNREDIDFYERQCVVFGKGNKERIVYFNARTKLHLQKYLKERTDTNPALFVTLHSPQKRLTISGVEVRIRQLGQALSMPKVHPHKFRRTLATMAIDKGMPIEQVQRLLGHVRIDTTLHYAIVNQNNVKLAHKKYLG